VGRALAHVGCVWVHLTLFIETAKYVTAFGLSAAAGAQLLVEPATWVTKMGAASSVALLAADAPTLPALPFALLEQLLEHVEAGLRVGLEQARAADQSLQLDECTAVAALLQYALQPTSIEMQDLAALAVKATEDPQLLKRKLYMVSCAVNFCSKLLVPTCERQARSWANAVTTLLQSCFGVAAAWSNVHGSAEPATTAMPRRSVFAALTEAICHSWQHSLIASQDQVYRARGPEPVATTTGSWHSC
jgi:hypothetical protein